jgi:hypothetical protein
VELASFDKARRQAARQGAEFDKLGELVARTAFSFHLQKALLTVTPDGVLFAGGNAESCR